MSPTIKHSFWRLLDRWFRPRRPRSTLEAELAEILQRPHAGRDVQAWLRRHDYLVGMALGRSASPRGVLTDFGPGTPWACDFMVLGCGPAWWDAIFVHLDSPKARCDESNGRVSQAHRAARARIASWRDMVASHRVALRAQLACALAPLRLPPSVPRANADAAAEIRQTDCAVSFQCCIVLGRRPTTVTRPRRRRQPGDAPATFWIATYDDLFEAARRFDAADVLERQSYLFWKG